MYDENESLLLSGMQHYAFCPRQWALIHLEQQWQDNAFTIQGKIVHERAHDNSIKEKRKDLLIVRDLSVFSRELGLRGKTDVVEFSHVQKEGISLAGETGLWRPFPIEYKRGKLQGSDADRLQLCAQALCLEEMLCCSIKKGAIYHSSVKRRELVIFTPELREKVKKMSKEMHQLYKRKYTPKCKEKKACKSCSLREVCLPTLKSRESVASYITRKIEE